MKPCAHCPAFAGLRHGMDPEAHDLLCDPAYCADPDYDRLYCPWEDRACPVHLHMKRVAARCHRKGVPIPYHIHPRYRVGTEDME